MVRTDEKDTDEHAAAPDTGPISLRGVELIGGRYQLERLLGTGGMGLVHLATDTILERRVAIKILADNLAADAESRARFEREAQSAARVTHPNVVQVYDVGEHHGRPYMVMEFIDGPSLADLLTELGTIPAELVHRTAIDSAAGLGAAHRAGLLHRDLKPGNLLRTPDGVVKVTDFGVAEARELPGLTKTGMVLGTLPYLAPERARGKPASVRTDIYGLGSTLYELLTGRAPAEHPGDIDHNEVLRTLHANTTAPAALLYELHRCVHPDPEERPVDAQDLIAGLRSQDPPPLPVPTTGQATRVLPQMETAHDHATTTVVMASLEDETRTLDAVGAVGASASDAPATSVLGADDTGWSEAEPVGTAGPSWWQRRTHPTKVALVIGGLATALAIGSGISGTGTPAAPPAEADVEQPAAPANEPAGEPAPEPEQPPAGDPVPRSDDPLEQARQLADWLRSQN